MWDAPLIKRMEGGRFHLRHGPIDLVVTCDGAWNAVEACLRGTFPSVLPELCAELHALRQPVRAGAVTGPVAMRMEAAALEFSDQFVTPMAAVAGAVADHLLGLLGGLDGVGAITANNGGDIALRPKRAMRIGICEDVATGNIGPRIEISPGDGVRGIATSGWRGRSHSLGVADAVTVLASSAAQADVAATLIANATDVDCAGVERMPASDLSPDSDLGDQLVTVDVPILTAAQKKAALAAGATLAKNHLRRGLIAGCFLSVQGETLALGQKHHTREKAIA